MRNLCILSLVIISSIGSISPGKVGSPYNKMIIEDSPNALECEVCQFEPIKEGKVQIADLALEAPVWKHERFVMAIAQHESHICPSGYNAKEQALGVLQIRPCVIQDLNTWGYKYTLADRRDMNKSRQIMEIYLEKYCREYQKNAPNSNGPVSIVIAASIWNGGPYGYLNMSSINYGETVMDLYNN